VLALGGPFARHRERDRNDMTRSVAPLVPAADADRFWTRRHGRLNGVTDEIYALRPHAATSGSRAGVRVD